MAEPAAPWKQGALDALERRELQGRVRGAIEELPDSYRVVLLLRDVEELDTQETAEALGITPANVKVRLHRARQALRTLLDREFGEGREA